MSAHRERGIVMVFTVIALPFLIAATSLAIDTGLIYAARTQMQNAADSAALAAMKAFRDTGSTASVVTEAAAVAALNRAAGEPVSVGPGDVEIGFFNETTRTFTAGFGFGVPAVRVSVSAPVRLNFAHLIGFATPSVGASATVAIRRRDLAIVQDRSGSFAPAWDQALDADRDLVTAMETQGVSGDQVGVVHFWSEVVEDIALTDLSSGGATEVRNAISAIPLCDNSIPGTECWTHTHEGIDRARQTILGTGSPGTAERVMVIVSDGIACMRDATGAANHVDAHALALAAADEAEAVGINVFVITLDAPGPLTGTGHVCFDPPAGLTAGERNAELVRGFGRAFSTPNEDDLDELTVSIIQNMPFFLVR